MKVLFLGDIMCGGAFHYQSKKIEDDLRQELGSFDIVVGTLECAIGSEELGYDETKKKGRWNIIYARPYDVKLLEEINVSVVSLANNHVCDLGEVGLQNAIDLCNYHSVKHCGAGRNIEDARRPSVVMKDGKTIAFLAYCTANDESLGYVKVATETDYGVAPLDMNMVKEDVLKAKSLYDYVVVLPHWGEEYEYLPTPNCVKMAQEMIDIGADAVIGSHAHNVQPVIKYKGKAICFGLGNFMFPDYAMKPPRPIYYPLRSVFEKLPRYYGYPFPINEPRMQVWEGRYRIGMIASLNLESSKIKTKLVRLSNECVVGYYKCFNEKVKKLRLKIIGEFAKRSVYDKFYRWYYSRPNHVRNFVHRIVDKLGLNFDVEVKDVINEKNR